MNKKLSIALLSALLLLSLGVQAGADDFKARFLERKPTLNSLKDRGVVGENNRGFLDFIGANREGQNVVQEENADRAKVYADIAGQTGANPDQVGMQRARKIAEIEGGGHFVQDAGGNWVKK